MRKSGLDPISPKLQTNEKYILIISQDSKATLSMVNSLIAPESELQPPLCSFSLLHISLLKFLPHFVCVLLFEF